jgi:hypothetical protein
MMKRAFNKRRARASSTPAVIYEFANRSERMDQSYEEFSLSDHLMWGHRLKVLRDAVMELWHIVLEDESYTGDYLAAINAGLNKCIEKIDGARSMGDDYLCKAWPEVDSVLGFYYDGCPHEQAARKARARRGGIAGRIAGVLMAIAEKVGG